MHDDVGGAPRQAAARCARGAEILGNFARGSSVGTVNPVDTLKQSGRISIAVASSRVFGLVRESLFAALFGGGAVADAFQVAFRIPNLLRDLLAEGALSSAFVPTFTQVLTNEGEAAAHRLARLVLGVALLVTGILTAAGMAFARPLVMAISLGFAGDEAKVALAVSLTRIMMPILALMSMGAVWMGILNARRRFMAPALAPVAFNTVSIVVGAVLVWRGEEARTAIYVWSAAATVAGLAQVLIQWPALRRLGVKVAVDNFGTGSNALSILTDVGADILKLDGALALPSGASDSDTRLVRALVLLAHALDMQVIAERVSGMEQLRRLRAAGCDFAQGNLLGEPTPADQFAASMYSTPAPMVQPQRVSLADTEGGARPAL